MKRGVLGKCPVCSGELEITKLYCDLCDTTIEGKFELCKFCKLTDDQKKFVEVFIKSRGNIKEVEKELGISYPTVRSKLDQVIISLGYHVESTEEEGKSISNRRREILESLNQGEITSEEAVKLLKEITL